MKIARQRRVVENKRREKEKEKWQKEKELKKIERNLKNKEEQLEETCRQIKSLQDKIREIKSLLSGEKRLTIKKEIPSHYNLVVSYIQQYSTNPKEDIKKIKEDPDFYQYLLKKIKK